jgi:hypothetical protein
VKLSGVLGLYLGWAGGLTFMVGLLAGFVFAAAEGLALPILLGTISRSFASPADTSAEAVYYVALVFRQVSGPCGRPQGSRRRRTRRRHRQSGRKCLHGREPAGDVKRRG